MTSYQLQPNSYKLVLLVGPTSSGKSELAVKLAKKFNGEIISADSRQIYKGMNLGTGKVVGRWALSPVLRGDVSSASERQRCGRKTFIYKNIPHHCIDYINPKRQYSSANFQRDAKKAIADILKRGKLPILCGGTAHWVDAVVYNQQLPDVKPNKKLRAKLEKKSVDVLFKQLSKLDPSRAATIDKKNPHRLIRALEIVITTGKPVPQRDPSDALGMTQYDSLWLGIQTNQKVLYKKIDERLKQRLKQGMIKEVEMLHSGSLLLRGRAREGGLSWKKLEAFGLEYKFIALYLQKKINYDELITQLSYAIKHYSKRQLTWWKRNKDIKWFTLKDKIKFIKATKKFLN